MVFAHIADLSYWYDRHAMCAESDVGLCGPLHTLQTYHTGINYRHAMCAETYVELCGPLHTLQTYHAGINYRHAMCAESYVTVALCAHCRPIILVL